MKYPSLMYVGSYAVAVLALAFMPVIEVAVMAVIGIAIVELVLVPAILATKNTDATHRAD